MSMSPKHANDDPTDADARAAAASNVYRRFRAHVLDAVAALAEEGALPKDLATTAVTVEPPKDPTHGDLATNAAMVLAKPAKAKPRDIAEALAARLETLREVHSAEVAGPGFLNLRVDPAVWRGAVSAALKAGSDFGRATLGAGRRVCVEYVSANPTGPLHVGHTRGAVFGDALANLLAFSGWAVTREYYINDAGAQVDVLARSAYLRYREAHGEVVEIPEGLYPGDYLAPVGVALKEQYGDRFMAVPEEAWLPEIRAFAIDAMIGLIREDLTALGVRMDRFFSEKSLYGTGRIEEALQRLRSQDLIYEGVLEPPKGKVPEDWEPREQTLFRSTAHGDDVDRPVMKSTGEWTYFAPDIAYHYDKIERGFDLLIDVFGADHGGYVKRMKAAVSALSAQKTPIEIKLVQLVKLFKDGAPFRMGKRSGAFITLRDLLDEVGADVTRFVMLTRKNDAPLDFDFAKALEQSKDNPVWYVQYAHARIASTLREAAKEFSPGVEGSGAGAGFAEGPLTDAALSAVDLTPLDAPGQVTLMRKLAEWPRQVEAAAGAQEPHRIAFALYDLASALHAHYHEGKGDPGLRFHVKADLAASLPRLAMIRAVAVALDAGLNILGVTPLEELR
ncbi:MAG: arginine--tRNA ligase [Pseudomonadota bacterium]